MDTAARYYSEGADLLAEGRLAEALTRCDTAIGLADPGSRMLANCLALQGEVQLRQGHPQTARAAFTRALEVNPAHVPARVGVANAYRVLRRPSAAIPYLLEAVQLCEDDVEKGHLRRVLADTYREANRPHMARRVLRAGSVGRMTASEKVRALPSLVIPDSWLAKGLLLLVGVIIGALWVLGHANIAAVLLVACVFIYGAVIWLAK
jgi:tetratricopeptide (TPR) repeat protein